MTPFERAVMSALTAGDHPILEALRAQAVLATVTHRDIVGPSSYTYFEVAPVARRLPHKSLRIGDLQLQLQGAMTPADAVLHVENGVLKSLECYVYDGQFPAKPEITAAWYYGSPRFPGVTDELLAARDLEEALSDDED